jgi:hypothetical protein
MLLAPVLLIYTPPWADVLSPPVKQAIGVNDGVLNNMAKS